MRRAKAARLLTFRVFTDSTLPPLMLLSGHKPIQEANAAGLIESVKFCRSSKAAVCKRAIAAIP